MSKPFPDDEICTYSLFMAKNLITQMLTNLVDEADERLDTDVPSQSPANDSIVNAERLYNPKFDSFAIRINRSEFSEGKKHLEHTQVETDLIHEEENVTEMESEKSIEEEDPDMIEEDIEIGPLPSSRTMKRIEDSISNIFEKKDAGESSMFPFSFLGGEIEVKRH